MGKIKIQQEALRLSPLELAELIMNLNQALEQKLKVLLRTPENEGFLKEIVPNEGTGHLQNQRFLLEDFLSYEQGKLYLAGIPEKNRINYTLFTLHAAGIESIVTLRNTGNNWPDMLLPYISDFFTL